LHNRKIEGENEERSRIITEIVVNDLLLLKKKNTVKENSENENE
jgi:hypothetical protein